MRFSKILFYFIICCVISFTNSSVFSKAIGGTNLETNHYNAVWKFYKEDYNEGPDSLMPFYISFNSKYLLLLDEYTKITSVFSIKKIKNNSISAKCISTYEIDDKGKITKNSIKDGINISIKINNNEMHFDDGEHGATLKKISTNPNQIYPESLVVKFLN